MKKNELLDALGEADEALVERADRLMTGATRRRRIARLLIPLVASLLVAATLFCVFAVPHIRYINTPISAYDIAKVTPGGVSDGVAISSYKEVCYPADGPTSLVSIPNTKYLDIYAAKNTGKPIDKDEFESFKSNILEKLTVSLGHSVELDRAKEHEYRIYSYYTGGGHRVEFEQQAGGKRDMTFTYYPEALNSFSVSKDYNSAPADIKLNGRSVSIKADQTEAEILLELEWVRDILFEIIGQKLDSSRVELYYNKESSSPLPAGITVYYFNESDREIGGDEVMLYLSGGASSCTLASIRYSDFRLSSRERYGVMSRVRRLTLEDAEALLAQGYVWGGHACDCIKEQAKIDFEEYDYVGFEYIGCEDVTVSSQNRGLSVPFYAFYKKLRTLENGNVIYAKTYVCAVDLPDLQEYFAEQAKLYH